MKSIINIKIALFLFLGLFGNSILTSAQWAMEKDMGENLDAISFSPNQESMILISGNAFQYISLVEETKYEINALTAIENFPTDWEYVQAAVQWNNSEILFFQGTSFCIFDAVEGRIKSNASWPGWPVEWQGQVDAAVRWGDDQIMFLLADEYVIYNIDSQSYDEPDLITNWEGWPTDWSDGISAAINIYDGFIYFFRDSQFIAYDLEKNKFVPKMNIVSN